MERNRLYVYPDVETLTAAFVCEFTKFLQTSSKSIRPLNVALSGGSTPLKIFRQLNAATKPEDWSRIHLYWGDERCVPPGDPQSNYGQAENLLISPLGLHEKQVHRIRGEMDPEQESQRYGEVLTDLLPVEKGTPVFDWIWLGLGEDGHTVSIFPDQIELWNSDDPCVVASHPATGQKRITITGRIINAAKRVSVLVAGKNKQLVVREIIRREGKYMDLPASYIAPLSGSSEWYLDKEAAAGL